MSLWRSSVSAGSDGSLLLRGPVPSGGMRCGDHFGRLVDPLCSVVLFAG